ncbi:aryl-sulfate sulfotransferase, partial [Candidatus Margulisiibacteriota bacterium]
MKLIIIILSAVFFFTSASLSMGENPNKKTGNSDIVIDVYDSDKAWEGATIFPDNHDPDQPRIIEVDMQGKIVWAYVIPGHLRRYTNPGFDIEALENGNVLFSLPRQGIYEINRQGEIVWSHLDGKVSHDVDRLANGNTLYVFGNEDQIDDAQVKEVNPKGELVWSWQAGDHFNKSPYKEYYRQGWTHTNAVSRLENGNTLISLRNFNFIVEVDPQGEVVRIIKEGNLRRQHDPQVLPNGNILIANHQQPHEAIEVDLGTGEIVWRFSMPPEHLRDANRLPNGNTLVTGTTKIAEV